MNARGMTPIGVQVLGTILNKCVSTADYYRGYKWQDIPDALQVHGLGDLKSLDLHCVNGYPVT